MSASSVQRVFDHLFGSHEDASRLLDQLKQISTKEVSRVQLAVLKLSDGDPDKLQHYIEAAQIDYRDVLAWAEYPQQMRSGATRSNTPRDEYETILAADRRQYESWLEKFQE